MASLLTRSCAGYVPVLPCIQISKYIEGKNRFYYTGIERRRLSPFFQNFFNFFKPLILQMVDDGRIAFNPAVEISYMTGEHQTWLKEEMDMCDATPSLVQSRTLKDMSRNGTLTENYLHTLLTEEKPNQRQKFFLNQSDVQQYFPSNYTPQQMQNVIISLLRNWEHKRSSRQHPQREDELER